MAKDPAILFYTSDFLTGTFTMTDEQVGRYIKLLCLQHQKGLLQMSDLEFVCRGKDQVVFDKFQNDGHGNFFNKTLKEHSEKRKAYSESRRENRKPKEHMNNISKTYDKHMENEIENEIKDEKETGSKKPEEILTLPFESDNFKAVWETLLKEKNWKKKSTAALKASLKKLSKECEADAIKMIENATTGEWKGLFELKPHEKYTNGTSKKIEPSFKHGGPGNL